MDRLLKRWKLISLVLGSVLTCLGIIAAYASAGFPVPATDGDIAVLERQIVGLEKFSTRTRVLILYQDILRYKTKVNVLKVRIQNARQGPKRTKMIEELSTYEILLQKTERLIDRLDGGN